jgi:hypothetical protein
VRWHSRPASKHSASQDERNKVESNFESMFIRHTAATHQCFPLQNPNTFSDPVLQEIQTAVLRRDDRPSQTPDLGTERQPRSSLATLTTTPKRTQFNHAGATTITIHITQLKSCQSIIKERRVLYSNCDVTPAHPPLRRRARAAQNRRAEWVHIPLYIRNASVGEME